jgi:seryl-tRNA synthetase
MGRSLSWSHSLSCKADNGCSEVAYSTCYRKEAGSHGKDAWGIFRVHQFEKVSIDPRFKAPETMATML